jgi:signal transduction histidine kinase
LAPLGAARHRTGRGSVDRIISNVTRASDILRRLRDLTKKQSPQKEVLDVNAAILEVMALAHSEAVKSGVMVRTRLASQLPPIEGDRIQLQQVMLNLIVNAIQAMSGEDDAGRDLEINTETVEPRGVLIGVRDTGPGLSPVALPRLFEPFYTTKPGGMGMGLSICRSIVEAHGGRLCASANEPKGAHFQFTIPGV